LFLEVENNIPALYAENALNQTQASLQITLEQLSSGTVLNSGADNPAALSIVDGMAANVAALNQSVINATEGVGLLQVADGALSQVTNLLTSAVTLATEASNGTLNSSQDGAANEEFQSILAEINNIGTTTTYNSQQVFTGSAGVGIFVGDASASGASQDNLYFAPLTSATVGDAGGQVVSTGSNTLNYQQASGGDQTSNLEATNLANPANAQTALIAINAAIGDVAAQRGYIGSQINSLNTFTSVETTEAENLTAAETALSATNYGQATTDMSQDEVLMQTGISALAQANSVQQEILKLLQ
jgi:flagellin